MHRFYVPDLKIKDRLTTLTHPRQIHQIRRVLRMRPGDQLALFNGTKPENFLMEILEMDGRSVGLHLREVQANVLEPKRAVHLFQAIPKKAALFDLIIQKATEIGVSHIYPLITERTENRRLSKAERRETIAVEATEQSGRAFIPYIHSPVSFADAIRNAPNPYLGYEFARGNSLMDCWPSIETKKELSVFIGPEGGFSNDEIALAGERHVQIFSLGKRILRVETATLATLSIVLLAHADQK